MANERFRRLVERRAGGLCEYCRHPQDHATERYALEHINPRAAGGPDDDANRAFSCHGCNGYKGVKTTARDPETNTLVSLYNPRQERWADHFAWSADGLEILGLTPTGRATIALLHLNRQGLHNLRYVLRVAYQPDAE